MKSYTIKYKSSELNFYMCDYGLKLFNRVWVRNGMG